MKHLNPRFIVAAIVLTTLGLAGTGSGHAQQPARDLVPYKATVTGTADVFTLPTDPPLLSQRINGTGEDNVLGAFTIVEHMVTRLGADGKPLSFAEGVYVSTAANGDAIFGTFSGLFRPSAKPGFAGFDAVWLITGGKGRFAGAAGGGVASGELELATGKGTFTQEGLVTRPRP